LLANTVTGDAARRKRVAFHAAVCDSDRARQPLFPRSGAAARPLWDAGEHQPLSLGQAAKACGRSKSALSRHQSGQVLCLLQPRRITGDRPRRTV
jgi:hypothetical protein